MNREFSLLVQQMGATLLPHLRGDCREEWGSTMRESRISIRQDLVQKLSDLSTEDQSALLNLTEPPRPTDWSVSISHTHDIGGWVAVRRPLQVGWDIELKSRIQDHIVQRVCQKDELQDTPHSRYLWCAKEAFYKALEDEQPQTIPELTIKDWRRLPNDQAQTRSESPSSIWLWTGLGPQNGQGVLIESDQWIMAIGAVVVGK